MNERFVRCLVDALLPGDDGDPPLPCASEIGVDRIVSARMAADEGGAIRHAIASVARAAGSAHEFARSSGDVRSAAIATAERDASADVRSLVACALEAYYQSEPVIRAMGWRPQSPQPLGHPVDPLDPALLEPVRSRGPLWRETGL